MLRMMVILLSISIVVPASARHPLKDAESFRLKLNVSNGRGVNIPHKAMLNTAKLSLRRNGIKFGTEPKKVYDATIEVDIVTMNITGTRGTTLGVVASWTTKVLTNGHLLAWDEGPGLLITGTEGDMKNELKTDLQDMLDEFSVHYLDAQD